MTRSWRNRALRLRTAGSTADRQSRASSSPATTRSPPVTFYVAPSTRLGRGCDSAPDGVSPAPGRRNAAQRRHRHSRVHRYDAFRIESPTALATAPHLSLGYRPDSHRFSRRRQRSVSACGRQRTGATSVYPVEPRSRAFAQRRQGLAAALAKIGVARLERWRHRAESPAAARAVATLAAVGDPCRRCGADRGACAQPIARHEAAGLGLRPRRSRAPRNRARAATRTEAPTTPNRTQGGCSAESTSRRARAPARMRANARARRRAAMRGSRRTTPASQTRRPTDAGFAQHFEHDLVRMRRAGVARGVDESILRRAYAGYA